MRAMKAGSWPAVARQDSAAFDAACSSAANRIAARTVADFGQAFAVTA